MWRQIIIQAKDFARIKLMNDTVRTYNFKIDTVTKKAVVFPAWDTVNKASFTYIRDAEYLILSGRIKTDSVYMRFKRFDEKNFRLMSRGFHWINEYPYNR